YVFLMGIDQFRRIYPEYDSLSDDVVAEKLRLQFFPEFTQASFTKQFLVESKELKTSVLADLYVKRGDAYAGLDDVRKANAEYDRVSRAFPEWAQVSFTEVRGKRVRNAE